MNEADPPQPFPTVTLRGVSFAQVTEAETVDLVLDALAAGRGGWMITSNLDHLLRAGKDAEFRAMLDEADVVVADGKPLVWAARLRGTPLPERVAGSSLVSTLSAAAAKRGRTLFLLGGDEGIADAAATVLTKRYPGLRIAGTYYPPMGFERDPDQMRQIGEALRAAKPNIVYVALGSPKQERLIRTLRGEAPGAWWIGVGISLSFLAGHVDRAPRWMQAVGLEWLHRMAQEPRRLFRRYVIDGIPFAVGLLAGSALARLSGRR